MWVLHGTLQGPMCLQEGVEPFSCWGLGRTTTRTAPAAWGCHRPCHWQLLPSIFCQNPCHESKPFYAASSSSQKQQDQCVGRRGWDCEACHWGHVGTVATAEQHCAFNIQL